jgi:MFS family permease
MNNDPSLNSTESSSLSPSQTARALRVFLLNSVLWAAWGTSCGLGTSVFTGYLLWLGASDADNAYLMSISFFASIAQIVFLKYTRRSRNPRRLIVGCGTFEILGRFLTIAIPFVFVSIHYKVASLYVLTLLGLCAGYAITPKYNDWMAHVIPVNLRARYTGDRALASMVTAMLTGYLFGKFIDMFPEGGDQFTGFAWLLIIGLVTGLGGYIILLWAPIPDISGSESKGILKCMWEIVRNRAFGRLLALVVLWQFAVGMSTPFTPVFMIEDLKLSYTTMAVYGNIAMAATALCYHPLGWLVDRFGSKPVMQVILIPGVIGQFLRVFSKPDFHLLLPVSFTLFSIFGAALSVATTPLFYALLPKQKDRTEYFVAWTTLIYIFGGLAPLAGAFISNQLKGVRYEWFGCPIGNHQFVFVATTVGVLLMFPILFSLEERKAQTATGLIAEVWKGNPIYYLYNFFAMNVIGGEAQRARAATGMARSGSPLAAEELIKALTDLSPDVRRKAVEGLAILSTDEAVGPLIEQLANKESDIRAEAAEALGRIGHPLSLDALREALDDEDPRVRMSAVRGLGSVAGQGVRDLLFQRLQEANDRQLFPTIVDVLSRVGDVRVVTPAIERLAEYKSPVVRAQLYNSVCRALGAKDYFYRLAIMDELQQASRVASALEKAQKDASALRGELASLSGQLVPLLERIRIRFDEGKTDEVFRGMVDLARLVVDGTQALSASGNIEIGEDLTMARGMAAALLLLSSVVPEDEIGQQEFLLATVCATVSVRALTGKEAP